MIKVQRIENESGEKLLRRFSSHIKSTRIQKWFRRNRYFVHNVTKKKQREIAISREAHRTENKKKRFASAS